jgi:predicted membrane-bound spermidine synthase
MGTVMENRGPARAILYLAAVLAAFALVSLTGIAVGPAGDWIAFLRGRQPFLGPALLASFLVFALSRPGRVPIAVAGAAGLLVEAVLGGYRFAQGADAVDVASGLGAGLGLSAIAASAVLAVRSRGDHALRGVRLSVLAAASIPPLAALVARFVADLSGSLQPRTLDRAFALADGALGFQPSFALARMAAGLPPVEWLASAAWLGVPVALALVWGTSDRAARARLLAGAGWVAVLGGILLLAVPAAGPAVAFPMAFPLEPPAPGSLDPAMALASPSWRDAAVALPVAWALVALWNLAGRSLAVRLAAAAWVVLASLAGPALGLTWAGGVIGAFPLALLALALALPPALAARPGRGGLIAIAALLEVGWIALVRLRPGLLDASPVAAWAAAALAIAAPLYLGRRASLVAAAAGDAAPAMDPDSATPADRRTTLVVSVLFFLSGFAGLLYEVVFAKSLALAFGSTAVASTTVLATYMGGMALGSWIGGRIGARRRHPLRAYALCELGIGVACALSPWTFRAVRALYVALAAGTDPASPALVALQVALGGLALLPPTVLMGLTLPLLIRHFEARDPSLGRSVGLLYGANTLGAALGSLATGYVVLPALGVLHATWAAVAANFAVAFVGFRLQRYSDRLLPAAAAGDPTADASPAPAAPPDRRLGIVVLVLLGVGGIVTIALETVYIHLLAVVAGSTAYAFALMLFTFLVGLGLGSAFTRARLKSNPSLPVLLAWCELALAGALLAGVFLWNRLPDHFASYASYRLVREFGAREFVRGVVCCLAMIPPALCIGGLYPLAMEGVGRAWPDRRVRAMGTAAAINTLGNIAGALLGGFVLLPLAGSLRSVHILAGVALALALAPWLLARGADRLRSLALLPVVLVLVALQPSSFDWTSIASGANVYFESQSYGRVIDHAESLDGGLTTVAKAGPDSAPVLTLLTNGKFQGDDSPEVGAQFGFAMCPLLHTTARDRALNIGFGTGTTARTLRDAGFRSLDVVDLSGDILRVADEWFPRVNKRVLSQPGVASYVTDGRNFLLLQDRRYDLVTIELTSIWFAGAAALYNREFYDLVLSRLAPEGVLEQWIQLHRLSREDIVSVIGTLRERFPRIWLYYTGNQGVLVACTHDCSPNPAAANRLHSEPALREALAWFGGSSNALAGSVLLDPPAIDRLLATAGFPVTLSTDDNLFLEYSTPRGNVRSYSSSIRENVAWLRTFAQ